LNLSATRNFFKDLACPRWIRRSRWRAGSDTRKRRKKHNMALTREYEQKVVARIRRDKKFARVLCTEVFDALLEGETVVLL